ncbi:hypothetical protein Pmani_013704 [Petrolisthes manimaculis]|uniref:Uncharacterized protein n=1 Tax=Petrolisthes manimaculis TaxID=1843537 RepID=A0AAE1PVJ0_9EUCA|nr:hypothetical protein Pmani_013704 [Petrolisthes manimaculis]
MTNGPQHGRLSDFCDVMSECRVGGMTSISSLWFEQWWEEAVLYCVTCPHSLAPPVHFSCISTIVPGSIVGFLTAVCEASQDEGVGGGLWCMWLWVWWAASWGGTEAQG